MVGDEKESDGGWRETPGIYCINFLKQISSRLSPLTFNLNLLTALYEAYLTIYDFCDQINENKYIVRRKKKENRK